MKAREEQRLSTLRMVKSALKNREIEKRAPLDEKESQAILATLIKQRKESVESFTRGNRPELAEKERAEIGMIEGYLPQAVGEDLIREVVAGAIDTLTQDSGGARPGPKDMGTLMKVVLQRILADGLRADRQLVSEIVKAELAK
jgi:uncharacterized protein YqeY